MIEEIILPLLFFYKKEKIVLKANLEKNKIEYRRLKRDLISKKKEALESSDLDKEKKLEIKNTFNNEIKFIKRKLKEEKDKIKIQYMEDVSQNKKIKEEISLSKKSKSNLHQTLFTYARQSFEDKKNSLVVVELAPSGELMFSIKRRIFNDLSAYGDKHNDRVYAGEKDILFTNIRIGNSNERIPMFFRYSGQCVPIFLESVRSDTFDKFSTENEHHIMLLSERLREIKAPNKKLKLNRKTGMFILTCVLGAVYLIYRYMNGQLI